MTVDNDSIAFEVMFGQMCVSNDINPGGDYAEDIKEYCRLCFQAGVRHGESVKGAKPKKSAVKEPA